MVYLGILEALTLSVCISNVVASLSNAASIPPGAVVRILWILRYWHLTNLYQSIPPLSFAVMGQNATFRQNGFIQTFNPTNNTPPFFQIFHSDFLDILGPKATVRTIAVNNTFASGFAFEAPFFNAPTNEIFFASSVFVPESSFNHSNRISKINLTLVEEALAANVADINIPFTTVSVCSYSLNTSWLIVNSCRFRKQYKLQTEPLVLSRDLSYWPREAEEICHPHLCY